MPSPWKNGKCARGHDLAVHMRVYGKGRSRRCRACQQLSDKRLRVANKPALRATVSAAHSVPADNGLWRTRAHCRYADPELFYDRDRIPQAAAWCSTCPVVAECLANARATGERFGFRGGTWFGKPTAVAA